MKLHRTYKALGSAEPEHLLKETISDSKIEQMICDNSFGYIQPWFYNNPYALRCELGIGDNNRAYMKSAYRRAVEIFDILFPTHPDAMMFDFFVEDYSLYDNPVIRNIADTEQKSLRFLAEHYRKYKHRVVSNIPLDEDETETAGKNRIICYSFGIPFDYKARIKEQIEGRGNTVSYVSFANECIFSVYDERGCDIVFATKEKMKEFFDKLNPYLLEYDIEEMKRRIG